MTESPPPRISLMSWMRPGFDCASTDLVQIIRAPAQYKLLDAAMVDSMCNELAGIFSSDDLNALRWWHYAPETYSMFIFWCHLSFRDSKSLENAASLRQMCEREIQYPPPYEGTFHYVAKFASHAKELCFLRVDESGHSVCSGKRAIIVKFQLIGREGDNFVIWFLHPTQSNLLCAMDLSSKELPGLEHRISVTASFSVTSSQQWSSGPGSRKPLTVRAKLAKVAEKTCLVMPSPHGCFPLDIQEEMVTNLC
jgi:hypothetical protein